MKKYIISSLFALTLFVHPVYADTVLQTQYKNALMQLISLLTQQVNDLIIQLNTLKAEQGIKIAAVPVPNFVSALPSSPSSVPTGGSVDSGTTVSNTITNTVNTINTMDTQQAQISKTLTISPNGQSKSLEANQDTVPFGFTIQYLENGVAIEGVPVTVTTDREVIITGAQHILMDQTKNTSRIQGVGKNYIVGAEFFFNAFEPGAYHVTVTSGETTASTTFTYLQN